MGYEVRDGGRGGKGARHRGRAGTRGAWDADAGGWHATVCFGTCDSPSRLATRNHPDSQRFTPFSPLFFFIFFYSY